MWHWLLGSWRTLGYVALSTALIYFSTLAGVRLAERRTLAEMSGFDFIVAVSLGAIVGRTATTPSPSYAQGLTAVVTLLTAHRALSWVRVRSGLAQRLVSRPALLLVSMGQIVPGALRRAHLTVDDLYCVLREHGVRSIDDVTAVVIEPRGAFSVIRKGDGTVESDILRGVQSPE